MKKITGDESHAHYQKVCETTGEIRQIHPEYATMSRKPGIGKDWYDRYNSDVFPNDTTIYKGKNIRTPRYYEDLLRSANEELFNDIKRKRKEKAYLHSDNNTPERLRVREKVKLASMQNITRKLHE